MKIFSCKGDFNLERGGKLKDIEIAYTTYGKLNEKGDNVIWVCHALTADSDVNAWWPNTVTKDGFLDPDRWFVVCANIIGSCYGSTGPLSINPDTGKPYFKEFPSLTIRDLVKAHILLRKELKIKEIFAVIGSSLGGFQAMEWSLIEPEKIKRLVLIATDTEVTPWAAAFNETQRMALKADNTFGDLDEEAGKRGLAAARAIAMLSYRGGSGYNISQQNPSEHPPFTHRASTYQTHQGNKLCRRFNAYSYNTIIDAFDSHNIGRERGGVDAALAAIKAKTICIAITSDILFPPTPMKKINKGIKDSQYHEIKSDFGHDGFLVEYQQLNNILTTFLK